MALSNIVFCDSAILPCDSRCSIHSLNDAANFCPPADPFSDDDSDVAESEDAPVASPLIEHPAKSIDNAEDREKFSAMLDRIGVDQPRWRELTSMDDINEFVEEVGFPVLVRPSYVLSGAAMNVCSNQEELERFLQLAANVSKKHPVVVSQFIEHAKEVEMDAVAQNGEIVALSLIHISEPTRH